ncbi:Uncharacterised protein [Neisseria meningitidis]|nr:Uncharacterised protein [Neisseria meningitidis]CWO04007.1 Uncharacterised protein [Neisseria meningitidis]CWR23388.1 Uncharacterised protein [Neisseria meningitidis]
MYAGNTAFRLHCRDMPFCQIHHMNIVAHTRTVWGRVVIAENRQLRQFACRHLADIRQQIIRDAVWLLANQTTFVRANRIEITQQNHAPARIGFLNISENALNH